MKAVGFFVLFLVISTIMASLVICSRGNVFTVPGMQMHNGDEMLRENEEENKGHNIELEDYRPLDPVPTYKASIRPGPIQHGTPLMPYIPKPAPPASSPASPGPW
ncbi:hypothetical protein Leryth_015217 [Lithospermum erythrorhizon]|nr:hypothetical protein Leryth_015217 [Lithospermum erythrorhizon]